MPTGCSAHADVPVWEGYRGMQVVRGMLVVVVDAGGGGGQPLLFPVNAPAWHV